MDWRSLLNPDGYLWELLAGLGLVALTLGLGLAWLPLALIVPGAALVGFGLWGARIWAKPRPPEEE